MSEPTIRLYASSLLSKWGFGDGDDPDEWVDYCEAHGIDWMAIRYPLVELVRRHLLPALDQAVTVVEIETIHNPIRVETIDGVDVSDIWYSASFDDDRLTPEYVDVPLDEVARLALEVAG